MYRRANFVSSLCSIILVTYQLTCDCTIVFSFIESVTVGNNLPSYCFSIIKVSLDVACKDKSHQKNVTKWPMRKCMFLKHTKAAWLYYLVSPFYVFQPSGDFYVKQFFHSDHNWQFVKYASNFLLFYNCDRIFQFVFINFSSFYFWTLDVLNLFRNSF